MDFQRDYILRLIQMMGDLMRRIAELIDDLQRMRMLDDACRRFCGMTLTTAEDLSADSLRELLPTVPRLMLSELLYAKARSAALPTEDEQALLLKALQLLASLNDDSPLCSLRAVRLRELKQAVLPLTTAQDLLACARFFAQAEQYDEMEDALFQALALEPTLDRGEAIAMLRRAAKASAVALARCNMTSDELRASARELETTRQETSP